MKATVEQGEVKVVQCIWALHESPEAVIVAISTVDKHPLVQTFNSVTIYLNGCKIKFDDLPFNGGQMIFMPDRHMLQVCIYSDELLKPLLVPLNCNPKCLFNL